MRNKRRWARVFFFLLLFTVSCNKRKEISINEKENINKLKIKQPIFKDKPVKKVIDEFKEVSKKNRIEIEKFENIIFENKQFYYSKIKLKENTNYIVSYEELEVIGLFLKVGIINGGDLRIIEDMVVNLIEISDKNIKEDEARALYTEILAKMGENELTNSLKYKNEITYAIQIERESGELLFSAQ